MTALISRDEVTPGQELPGLDLPVTRSTLVMYAGSSGDFNPIHWNERIAKSVGLPDVIAHGMLTMGLAGRVITDWVGDPGALLSYEVRFSKPVVVPDDDHGALVRVNATVVEVDADGRATVDIIATTVAGDIAVEVLKHARAVVQLA